MPAAFVQLPSDERLIDRNALMTFKWLQYFNAQGNRIALSAERLNTQSPSAAAPLSASIGLTPFTPVSLAAGLYRVQYLAHITQAATTSSSLEVSVGWTRGGVSRSFLGPAMTGNTADEFQTDSYLIRVDNATPMTFETIYASAGATPMTYEIDLLLEKMF
jgi:hypothetical protein